jgi:hypothetical protein
LLLTAFCCLLCVHVNWFSNTCSKQLCHFIHCCIMVSLKWKQFLILAGISVYDIVVEDETQFQHRTLES